MAPVNMRTMRRLPTSPQTTSLRLGELIAGLSLVFDLGNDSPPEKALRNACPWPSAYDVKLGSKGRSCPTFTTLPSCGATGERQGTHDRVWCRMLLPFSHRSR